MRPRDVALAVLPPALWAIAYTIAKPTMQTFPPLFLMSIVYALTALALFRPWGSRQTPVWAVIAAATLGGSLQSALIFSGIALVPATLAVLTVQSQVPFAVLASWAIGQERMNGRRLLGVTVSLAGVALVVGLPDSVGELRGLLLIVLGTLCWGIAQGIIRATSRDSGGSLMGAMSVIAAPQLLAMSLLLETGQGKALFNASLFDWMAVLVLALGGFVAAYAIWYGLLRHYRVDQVAPFALLMPIIGVLIAFLFLNEQPTPLVLTGGVTILIGLGLVVRAPRTAKIQTA
ncbi:DMT family transporter [Mesorhizobium sp. IMUNJ 23232]|uniref:DMT family transporter n=1 Tax=Mesorhizobium sp. IMUNJ 23232 TaxID=3376064 RepID=UPI0037BB8E99